MEQSQVVIMTSDQLKEFAALILQGSGDSQTKHETPTGKRFVYGLRGIRDLFNVSHVTAQRYKDTFLAPAIIQRGRKIMVDVEKAIELYNDHKQTV